jgi:hypothetical protein
MCTAFFEGRPVEPPTATFPEWIAAIINSTSRFEKARPSSAWVGHSALPKDEEGDSTRS